MINIDQLRLRVEFNKVISLNNASKQCSTAIFTCTEITLSTDAVYNSDEYLAIKNQMSKETGRALFVVYSKDIFLANRLLWECNVFCGILYVDTDNAYLPEKLVTKRDRLLWDIQASFSKDSNQAFMSGWKNSYNNELFSDDEIGEYISDVVSKIAPFIDSDSRVLEIGCGSGMISDAIAPIVNTYDGCDISKEVLSRLAMSNSKNGINNMELYNFSADEIGKIKKQYDVILSSSVTEYFSGYNYLRNVIESAIALIDERGVIYFGDVFDLELKDLYMESVREYGTTHKTAKTSDSFLFELFIPQAFWYDVGSTDQSIKNVSISRKKGIIFNEINRFRYDVILGVDKTAKSNNSFIPQLFKYQFAGRGLQ